MQLLQEVIEITFKPQRGVVCLFSCDVEPGLRLNVLLTLTVLLHRKVVKLVGLNDLLRKLGLSLDRAWERQLLQVLEDLNDRVDWVVLLGLMAKAAFVARDASDGDDHDSDQAEDTKAFEVDAHEHERPRTDHDRGIK